MNVVREGRIVVRSIIYACVCEHRVDRWIGMETYGRVARGGCVALNSVGTERIYIPN